MFLLEIDVWFRLFLSAFWKGRLLLGSSTFGILLILFRKIWARMNALVMENLHQRAGLPVNHYIVLGSGSVIVAKDSSLWMQLCNTATAHNTTSNIINDHHFCPPFAYQQNLFSTTTCKSFLYITLPVSLGPSGWYHMHPQLLNSSYKYLNSPSMEHILYSQICWPVTLFHPLDTYVDHCISKFLLLQILWMHQDEADRAVTSIKENYHFTETVHLEVTTAADQYPVTVRCTIFHSWATGNWASCDAFSYGLLKDFERPTSHPNTVVTILAENSSGSTFVS